MLIIKRLNYIIVALMNILIYPSSMAKTSYQVVKTQSSQAKQLRWTDKLAEKMLDGYTIILVLMMVMMCFMPVIIWSMQY